MVVTGGRNKGSAGVKSALEWTEEKPSSKEGGKHEERKGCFLEGCENRADFKYRIYPVRMLAELIC